MKFIKKFREKLSKLTFSQLPVRIAPFGQMFQIEQQDGRT